MRSAQSVFCIGLALVIAAGCGSSAPRAGFDDQQKQDPTNPNGDPSLLGATGPFGGDPTKNVVLEPASATVIIDTAATPVVPGTQVFKVSKNGADVTAGATFTLKDTTLGTFNGATFTSLGSLPPGVLGKSTTVQVQTKEGQALGTVTVVALRKTGASRDFFFIVPYNENPTPKSDVLKFSTNIKQADVAFIMDTTGSMGQSINNLKTALSGTLFAQLQAAIPNVGLAVVDHKDFNSFDPWAVNVRQVVTTNLGAAQAAVNAMTAGGGGDEPEAQVAAMLFALTGQANNGGTPNLAAHTPSAPGLSGGVDFRAGSVPVLVEITDASWHDPSGTASIAALKAAFTAAKAKFVEIVLTDNGGPDAQANDLSDATGSSVPTTAFGAVAGCAAGQCCTGVNGVGRAPSAPGGMCRLNFYAANGNGVSGGIVQAIQAIAIGTTFDVTAVASNDPKNPNNVDATKFIKALRAMDEGNPAEGCPAAAAKDTNGDGIKDTFTAVKAGTPVCFEVIAAMNTTVQPALDPQFFNAFIDVMAVQGNLKLDNRKVLFLVPPKVDGVK